MKEYWKNFKEGNWCNKIDVEDFINKNYTSYEGDESFQWVLLLKLIK